MMKGSDYISKFFYKNVYSNIEETFFASKKLCTNIPPSSVGKITCFCFNYNHNLKFLITITIIQVQVIVSQLQFQLQLQ